MTSTNPEDFNVLVVDDESMVREVIGDLVTHAGYQVTQADSGPAALKILAETRVDLVITDLMMPGMSGWQLLKTVKQSFRGIPVVVLTGFISEEGEQMLTDHRIDGYLIKPIDNQRLQALLDTFRKAQKFEKPHRITVLDDDPVTLHVIEKSLGAMGFQVEGFVDPLQAVKNIRDQTPNLLILDLGLPKTDGFEVCRILRENKTTSRLPILILTANPSRENVAKALKWHVSGFLAKPFDPQDLLNRVRQILKINAPLKQKED